LSNLPPFNFPFLFSHRFTGEIGDVVVGRITEVAQKRWKVDINSRQDGVLLLSSVNLPGGVQRRRTESDELQMRSFFAEGDLLSAEIQSTFADGAASIHTRSLKYGKLRNGCLITVPPALVLRCKSHFTTLSNGIEVILGLNGYIWVSKRSAKPAETNDFEAMYTNKNEDIPLQTREAIARVCNCIRALAAHHVYINDTIIVYAVELAQVYAAKDLIKPELMAEIAMEAKARLEASK